MLDSLYSTLPDPTRAAVDADVQSILGRLQHLTPDRLAAERPRITHTTVRRHLELPNLSLFGAELAAP